MGKRTAPGSIYFVQPADGGPVKIGYAGNVETRLRELQVGSPVRLVVVATIPGTLADERTLHRRFAADRLHGEWFAPSEALQAHVRGLRATSRVEYGIAARPIPNRKMPRGRWLMLSRHLLGVMGDQWATARQVMVKASIEPQGRDASRVHSCLKHLHERGWLEKRVDTKTPPGYRPQPHQWRVR